MSRQLAETHGSHAVVAGLIIHATQYPWELSSEHLLERNWAELQFEKPRALIAATI
jgi:hypothetical protein